MFVSYTDVGNQCLNVAELHLINEQFEIKSCETVTLVNGEYAVYRQVCDDIIEIQMKKSNKITIVRLKYFFSRYSLKEVIFDD